jgi:hypothetical protein
MTFKNTFSEDINKKLMEKRFENDIQTTINIPEHKFKKVAEKFNYALKAVYDDYLNMNVKMFHILLSLQNYFDMKWIVDLILNKENKNIIKNEVSTEFNITKKKKKHVRAA